MLVILIGMAGLVVDGGQLTMQYRASQNAADAAALTAACVVCVMSSGGNPALALTGSGSLSVSGGNVQVNSLAPTYAMIVTSSPGLAVTSGKVYVAGGSIGTHISPTPLPGTAVSDPL